MKNNNIILTGFMGCGKTTVGELLAKVLGYQFVDTDRQIEQKLGLSVPEIFATHGEKRFREREQEISLQLSKKTKQVISTGGRLMLDPNNVASLGQSGVVFCLIATADEIYKRICNSTGPKRPLLESNDPYQTIIDLINERKQGYEQFQQIDTTGKTPSSIVTSIKNHLIR